MDIYYKKRQTRDELFPYTGCKNDQLRFLLRYATLAPSHYNAQPWKFKLGKKSVDIFCDPSRVAHIVDPNLREATISCGAAVGMFEVAARYFGYQTLVTHVDNQSNCVARIQLVDTHDPSEMDIELFQAIKLRQTNRGWFSHAQVPDSVVQAAEILGKRLDVGISIRYQKRIKEQFAFLTAAAVREQHALSWYRLEFASWLRSKFSLKLDGVMGFGFFSSNLPSPLVRSTTKWLNRGKQVADFNKQKVIEGSPSLAIISTDSDLTESLVNTGRLLSHLHLQLTTVGLDISYMNQAIQDPNRRVKVKALFESKACPQLILRIGKGKKVGWTQRFPVEDCLI